MATSPDKLGLGQVSSYSDSKIQQDASMSLAISCSALSELVARKAFPFRKAAVLNARNDQPTYGLLTL